MMIKSNVEVKQVYSFHEGTSVFVDSAGNEGICLSSALARQTCYLAKINRTVFFLVFKNRDWAIEWLNEKSKDSKIEILWDNAMDTPPGARVVWEESEE
jgi:hypothetical protein